jgi:hypothetical protein
MKEESHCGSECNTQNCSVMENCGIYICNQISELIFKVDAAFYHNNLVYYCFNGITQVSYGLFRCHLSVLLIEVKKYKNIPYLLSNCEFNFMLHGFRQVNFFFQCLLLS